MGYPNDMSRTADMVAGATASNNNLTNSKRAARNLIRKTYRLATVSQLANGSDAVAANAAPAVRMKNGGRVMGVHVYPTTGSTANGTNYATLALKPVIAGVAGNTIASASTTVAGGGSLVAGTNYPLTVDTSSNNDRFAAGTWLAAIITMTAAGVAVGAASWAIDVEEEDVDGYAA